MSCERFTCDRCGLCCRLIGDVPQLKQFDRGDGVCCHLTDENLCDIYKTRPEVCSVERMYSRFAAQMSEDEYCLMMKKSCEYLKDHFDDLKEAMFGSGSLTDSAKTSMEEDLKNLKNDVPAMSYDRLSREVGCLQ